MNILLLLEDKNGSANSKIGLNLADELGKNVHIGLIYVANRGLIINNESYKKIVKLGYYDETLIRYREEIDWYNTSFFYRIFKIFINPDFLYRFLKYKIYYLCKKNNLSKEIASYVNKNKIDAIIGIVNPYFIAEVLSKTKTTAKKYIVQLDPFSTNPEVDERKRDKYIHIEQKVHSGLDGIFTTKLIINDFNKYNILKRETKYVSIEFPVIGKRNKHDLNIESVLNKDDDNIYFVHAGMFYQDIRNPKILVELFSKLPSNYKLVVAGSNSQMIFDYCDNKNEQIIDLGCLSQEKSEKLKEEADFLISFNNRANNMVPSKLFECIDSGKPFLSISQIDDCPAKKYLYNYSNACIIDSNNMRDEANKIINFVSERKDIRIAENEICELFKECTANYVSTLIKKIIIEDLQL